MCQGGIVGKASITYAKLGWISATTSLPRMPCVVAPCVLICGVFDAQHDATLNQDTVLQQHIAQIQKPLQVCSLFWQAHAAIVHIQHTCWVGIGAGVACHSLTCIAHHSLVNWACHLQNPGIEQRLSVVVLRYLCRHLFTMWQAKHIGLVMH